jgi:hypothetical protein
MANKLKLTRREIALALSGSAVVLAQTPDPPPPQTPVVPSPDAELKAALEAIHQNSEQLAKFPLAMSTEPAARFKA